MSHSPPTGIATRTPCRRDRLTERLAGTRWAVPEVFATIGSTNTEAMKDPTVGRVLVADHQSSGRGRLARPWEAPPGASVAVSAVLPLPDDPTTWGWAPLLVGIAVRDALAPRAPHLGLKWPNDILARRTSSEDWHKLVGILCQSATGRAGPVMVAGVGINLDLTAEELPVETATSLRLLGSPVTDRENLVADVLDGLAEVEDVLHSGGSALEARRTDYRRGCVTLGQQVRVELPDGDLAGHAHSIDEQGRLVVEHAAGRTALAVGDVVHVRPGDAAERRLG